MSQGMRLGVNIDHVATLRQARGTIYPDPVQAAFIAVDAGADGITLHLREDRRHIQERDVRLLKDTLQVPMNLEMAATDSMILLAEKYRPEHVCLVPEKREELTTEGGLDVCSQEAHIKAVCARLAAADIEVSLFIDADNAQIAAARRCGAPVVELHTGHYADAVTADETKRHLGRIIQATHYADEIGLVVNAGHGLHYQNVQAIAQIAELKELNIGHSIIARAVFSGLEQAVRDMKNLLL